MKTVQHMIAENKGWFHIVFCITILSLLFIGMYLLYVLGFRFENLASAVTDCFFFLFCVYTGRWLCKIYLRKKLLGFLAVLSVSIVALAVTKLVLFKYVFEHLGASFLELSRDVMPFFLIAVVLGMFLKFVRSSVQKELRNAHLQAEQKTIELGLLQSQLSPHFLFNVLNNLYGISMDEHQRIPPLLLKLSNLLRYSLYGARKTFVTLQEELDYIQHYIEFEKIRISDRLIIETDIEKVTDYQIKIAPLILIVFIENAFKHAKNSFDQKIYIHISLKISGDFIHFIAMNSYRKEKKAGGTAEEQSGLGLANTLKRLELLYAHNYELKQHAGNDQYTVELTLKNAA